MPRHYHKQQYNKEGKDAVKRIKEKIPFAEEYTITDISLHHKGPQEDEYFLNHQELLPVVRRGNSEINGKIVRRGLQKFFDLKPNFFLDSTLKKDDQILYDHILKGHTYPLRVIKMSKANGENCQVSYFEELDAFIVASKNVAMAVRDAKDISLYNSPRYAFARLIAETWFKIIENKNINKIKSILKDHTFVGEYCGNQSYQHLVKYWSIDLIFYSVVPKSGDLNCWLVSKAVEIFKTLGLTVVDYLDYGVVNNEEQLMKLLNNISLDVTQNEIEKDQEGCVVYLEGERNQMLCKVKTLEYRIYRKIREKLKRAQQTDHKKLLGMIRNETKTLVDRSETPKALQYYFKLASIAFEASNLFSNEFLQNQLQGKYVNFMSIIVYCESTHKKPEKDMFFNDELVNQICKKTWTSYYKPGQILEEKDIKNVQIKNSKIFVIVPMTIPGSGKTYFKRYLQKACEQEKIAFYSISSDQIRLNLINQLKQKFKNLSEDDLFQKTNKPATSEFYTQLDQKISQAQNQGTALIYLDKNHPPNAIGLLQRNLEGQDVEVIYMNQTIPFSLEYILFCIYRVQNRDYHETLQKGKKSFEVIMMFVKFFQGWSDSDLAVNWAGKITGDGLAEGLKYVGQRNWQQLYQWWEEKGCKLTFQEVEQERMDTWIQQIFERMGVKSSYLKGNQKNENQILEKKQEIIPLDSNQISKDEQKKPLSLTSSKWETQELKKKGAQNQQYEKCPIYIGLAVLDDLKKMAETVLSQNHYNIGKLDYQPAFHITTLFIGKDRKKLEDNIYKQFQEHNKETVRAQSLIIIKDQIAFLSIKPLKSLCDNEFPHITLMTYAWKAKMSNMVLQSIRHMFHNGIIDSKYQNTIQEAKIQGEMHKVAIFKCENNIQTEAKKFF